MTEDVMGAAYNVALLLRQVRNQLSASGNWINGPLEEHRIRIDEALRTLDEAENDEDMGDPEARTEHVDAVVDDLKVVEDAAKKAYQLAVELKTCGRPVNFYQSLPEFLEELSKDVDGAFEAVRGKLEEAYDAGKSYGIDQGRLMQGLLNKHYREEHAAAQKAAAAPPRADLTAWATGVGP